MIEEEDIIRNGEFELWLGMNGVTTQAYTDLNEHPASLRIAEATGLDVPITIADWEEVLAAFKDLGVIPFTFGSNNRYQNLYGMFASAYGVNAGATFFQEDGNVYFSPLEDGYKDWVELFRKWYENGWLAPDYLGKHQNNDVRSDFDAGKMGVALLHVNSVTSCQPLLWH